MATNFPTSLDNSTTLPAESSSTPLSTNHVTAHQNMQDAMEAVQAKVGADSSAVTTSHDYKLSAITGTNKAVPNNGATIATPTITGATITTSSVNGVTLQTGGSSTDFLAANGSYVAGSVSNASTTAKGIVEAATSSEVTAGTATGGTGAVLVVTPDALAASTPVFNGSGLTGIPKLLNTVTTDVTFSSSTAENTVLSYSVPANTLGTTNIIRVTIHLSAIGFTGTGTGTIRCKYGATTLITRVLGGTSTSSFSGKLEFLLAGAGTTSSQNGSLAVHAGTDGYVGNGNTTPQYFASSVQGTSSEDSTASKTLAITYQASVNSANDNITASLIMVEVVR